ncbi:MAG: hypothetical protein ACM3S4_13555 [Burkholderiales bacterium]
MIENAVCAVEIAVHILNILLYISITIAIAVLCRFLKRKFAK